MFSQDFLLLAFDRRVFRGILAQNVATVIPAVNAN